MSCENLELKIAVNNLHILESKKLLASLNKPEAHVAESLKQVRRGRGQGKKENLSIHSQVATDFGRAQ
ncbi:hypothetical protein SUGI_1159470 [Cryptomeria japonica]|nr:hypothetical protein SUGI_1159470 [Cryptomeria japonica]